MKFNWNFINWSVWITLILTYIFPYQSTDGFATKYGYPFHFLTIYNYTTPKVSLLISNDINMILFAANILVFYLVIHFVNKLLIKQKNIND